MEEEAEAGLTNFHKLHNSAKRRSRDRLQRGGGATSLLHIFFCIFHFMVCLIVFSHPCRRDSNCIWPGAPVRFISQIVITAVRWNCCH